MTREMRGAVMNGSAFLFRRAWDFFLFYAAEDPDSPEKLLELQILGESVKVHFLNLSQNRIKFSYPCESLSKAEEFFILLS